MSWGQFASFTLGVVLGAAATFVLMEFSWRRQRKVAEAEKRSSRNNEIIKDTLKFFFRANDILNDLWVDKEVLFKFHKEVPEKSFEFEQRMVRRFDDSTRRDFFNELMFYSFQLKLLKDKTICDDFDALMATFKELSQRLLLAHSPEEYADLDKRYNEQKKNFLLKCLQSYT